MSATGPTSCTSLSTTTSERFHRIFDREPTPEELSVFSATHQALVLRLPGRLRRRTARVISRL